MIDKMMLTSASNMAAQEVTAAAGVAQKPRLLMPTNNRFWLGRLGSNVRIRAMHHHLVTSGWDVVVVFCGQCYETDTQAIERQQLTVHFTAPAQCAASTPEPASASAPAPAPASAPASVPAPASAGGTAATLPAAAAPAPGLRQQLRPAWRWLRAAASQGARPLPDGGWPAVWQEIGLRAQEPRVTDFADPRAVTLIQRLAAEQPFAVVLVQYVLYAWLVPALRQRLSANTRWLLDAHDVLHERQRRFHALGEVHGIDLHAAEETRWLSMFDAVLAIQRPDAAAFRAMGVQVPVLTVMHPHPLAAVPTRADAPLGVGFMGSAMAPNRLALRELVHEIWPRVHAVMGARARLWLAGAVCEALVGEALPPGVECLGYVDDLDDFYRRVDVVVSPLRIGGGLKIKNVEALCKGKPLLTTAVGAEGIDDPDGQAFVCAQSVDEFVDALLRVLSSDLERQAMARAALEFAAHNFSAAAAYRELDAWLRSQVLEPRQGLG